MHLADSAHWPFFQSTRDLLTRVPPWTLLFRDRSVHVQSTTPAFAAFRSQAKRSPGGSSRVQPEDSTPASKRNKASESAQEPGSTTAGSEVTLAHGIADAAVTSSEVGSHLVPWYISKLCRAQVAGAPVNDPELRSGASLMGQKGACLSLHRFFQQDSNLNMLEGSLAITFTIP